MKGLGDGADALQGAAQQCAQIAHGVGTVQAEALEGGLVDAREDPGLVGDARGVRAQGQKISLDFQHAQACCVSWTMMSQNTQRSLFRKYSREARSS